MKGILIILLVFAMVLLAAVGYALFSDFASSGTATLLPPPQGGVATPTPAVGLPATVPAALPTVAPPASATLPPVGGGGGGGSYTGAFAGTLTSDDGSTAPVSLNLTQSGTTVTGDIDIGDGLTINGGNCGAQAIPAGSRSVSGQAIPSGAEAGGVASWQAGRAKRSAGIKDEGGFTRSRVSRPWRRCKRGGATWCARWRPCPSR